MEKSTLFALFHGEMKVMKNARVTEMRRWAVELETDCVSLTNCLNSIFMYGLTKNSTFLCKVNNPSRGTDCSPFLSVRATEGLRLVLMLCQGFFAAAGWQDTGMQRLTNPAFVSFPASPSLEYVPLKADVKVSRLRQGDKVRSH